MLSLLTVDDIGQLKIVEGFLLIFPPLVTVGRILFIPTFYSCYLQYHILQENSDINLMKKSKTVNTSDQLVLQNCHKISFQYLF